MQDVPSERDENFVSTGGLPPDDRVGELVIAQSRPFDEQLSTVRALRRLGCCVALETWPAPGEWPGVLDRAARLGGAGWGAWSDGRGAERAAAAISDLAGRAR